MVPSCLIGFHFSLHDLKIQSLSKAKWIGNLSNYRVEVERSRSLTAACIGVSDSQTSFKTEECNFCKVQCPGLHPELPGVFKAASATVYTPRQLLNEVSTRHLLLIAIMLLICVSHSKQMFGFPEATLRLLCTQPTSWRWTHPDTSLVKSYW